MKERNLTRKSTQMVYIALFTAIIIAMSAIPFLGYIPLGVIRATTLHIPVILGSILLGPSSGAFLGFVFGMTSLLSNTFTPNITSFVFSPFYSLGDAQGNALSLVICFVPRILVGIIPYFVFCGLEKILRGKRPFALGCAGFVGSMMNTLLVMGMIFLFFGKEYAAAKEIPFEALLGTIATVIFTNGIAEAAVAAFVCVAAGTILLQVKKRTA